MMSAMGSFEAPATVTWAWLSFAYARATRSAIDCVPALLSRARMGFGGDVKDPDERGIGQVLREQ